MATINNSRAMNINAMPKGEQVQTAPARNERVYGQPAMATINTNTLVTNLIDAGLIGNIVSYTAMDPDRYEFGLDDISDAKLLPRCLRTAYTAVIGAALREDGFQGPLFDEEVETETTYKVEDGAAEAAKPLSLEAAKHYAAAVYRMALSASRHDDTHWLAQITKREVIKDADGNLIVSKTVVKIIKPFNEWLTEQIETTPQTDSWFVACIQAKQLGLYIDEAMGIDEAKELFTEWLNDIPWTRDGLSQTRRERIVSSIADRKWEAFKLALIANNRKVIERTLGDWGVMVFSAKMALDAIAIKTNPFYQLHLIELEQEKEEKELVKQEINLRMMEIKLAQAERKAKFDEMSQRLNSRIEQLTAKLPAPVAAPQPEPEAKPAVKGRAPRVINSRGAAH